MGRAKEGFIFVRCEHCQETVEIKYFRVKRWRMTCPACGKKIDVKYNY